MCSGHYIFSDLFKVDIESFRLFGGTIIFAFAFLYIVRGDKAFVRMKENVHDLPADIALPFMVGAGTISLSFFTGERHGMMTGGIALTVAMIINFAAILILKYLREHFPSRVRVAFDRFMDIFLRLNGFYVGAIGVEMIRTALSNIF